MKNLKSWLVLILVVFDFIKSRLNITEQFLSILALAIFGPNKLSTPLLSFSNSWCIVRHLSQLSHTACQIVGDNSSFRLWRRPKSWRIFSTVAADLGHLFMIGIVKWRLESHLTCVSLTYGFSLAPGTQHPTIQRNIQPKTCPTTTSNQTHQQLPDYVTQWYTPPKTNVKNRGYTKGWFGKGGLLLNMAMLGIYAKFLWNNFEPQKAPQCAFQSPQSAWFHCPGWFHKRSCSGHRARASFFAMEGSKLWIDSGLQPPNTWRNISTSLEIRAFLHVSNSFKENQSE